MALVQYTNIENDQSADANIWNSRYGDILAQLNGNLDASNIRNGTLTRELFAQDALLAAWPVNSVYISVEDVNPGSILGGSWVRFGQGRTLIGVDESDEDFKDPEATGGVKYVTLTTAQIPSHSHVVPRDGLGRSTGPSNTWSVSGSNTLAATRNTGGGEPHTNLQPYITVYFWKRVS